ncbi:MAG: hypothetical protein V1663_01700 [archaeon]
MNEPKFKVGDIVIILDKTYRMDCDNPESGVNWGSFHKGDIKVINSREFQQDRGKWYYELSQDSLRFWEEDLLWMEPAQEIKKRLKILENRFHVSIEYKITSYNKR